MYTNCPACSRQFRIRAGQLAAAEGLVQCGFCGRQFNALLRLYDRPLVLEPGPAGTRLDEDVAEPDFYIPQMDAAVATPSSTTRPGNQAVASPPPLVEPATDAATRSAPETPTPAIATRAQRDYPFADELIELTQAKTGSRSSRAWGAGVLVLLLAAALQAAWFNRDLVLTRYPQTLPLVRQLCRQLDCTLVRYRDISAIKLLNRDVRVHPRYQDVLLVNATISNLAAYAQQFPVVVLSLFDPNGKVIAYRQVPPADYLDNSIDIELGIQPGTPVHFVLEVANRGSDAVSFEFDFL